MRQFAIVLVMFAALTSHAQPVPLEEPSFTGFVAALLRKEVGDAAVTVKGPLTLGLGPLQANLDRVYAFCGRERSACEAELDRYVKGAVEAYKDRTAPVLRDAVRIVVRTSQYVQAAQSGVGGGAEIQPRPFVDGLVALPVVDGARTVRMLGAKDNVQLGLSETQIVELGLQNLRATLKPLMDVAKVARAGQIGRIAGDTYDPSRLLLHDTWEPLVKAQGGTLIVALPATDAVFYIAEDTPMAIDALRALTRNILARAPNRLSDVLLRWTAEGWALVP